MTRCLPLAGHVALSLLAMGCGREAPNEPRTTTLSAPAETASESAAVPESPPAELQCDESTLPPADLITGNIATTEASGIAEVVSAELTTLNGSKPPPASGYARLAYRVRVLDTFTGELRSEMVLAQGVELPVTPQPAGALLFFSGCIQPDGVAEPDVGYVFPIPASCRAVVAERARAAERGESICP